MNEELILETIKEYLIDDETRFIKDAVLMAHKKLNGYGYEGVDVEMLTLHALSVREFILNYCNIEKMPKGLMFTYVNMICASYLELYVVKNYVNGEAGEYSEKAISGAIASITEGDVSVTYKDNQSSDKILNAKALIGSLMDGYRAYLTRYRRMVW